MNKQMIIGLCVGGLLATAGGAFALRESAPKVADIIATTPITAGMEQQYAEVLQVSEHVSTDGPRFAEVVDTQAITSPGQDEEVCESVVVTRKAPVKDEHQIAGTATGAVVGGVLGNQVGGGDGKKVATAAGAIIGGIIGKKVQTNQQNKRTYQTTERQCEIVRGEDRVTGYEVTYTLDDVTDVVTLDYKPGKQIPVVDGQLVTDKAEAKRLAKRIAPRRYDVVYEINGDQGSVVLPKAPKVGDLLMAEDGMVVTDPAQLADIQARQHRVVAYKVKYRLGDEVSEVRMSEKPLGSTLKIKNGQVIMADAGGTTQLN
jgi:uncharacterized protein YcfJ